MREMDTSSRIYVGNLPNDATRRDLDDLFGKYGRVLDISLKRTQSGAPYAFIEYDDSRDADEAIRSRDGYAYGELKLRCQIPHASRGSRNDRGGGDRNRDGGSSKRSAGNPRRGEYRVHISGLPLSGSWQDLKDHMREAGECIYADTNRDGTGVVEYTRREDMEEAIRHLDGTKFRSHEGESSRITLRRGDAGGRSRSRSPAHRGHRDDYRDDRGGGDYSRRRHDSRDRGRGSSRSRTPARDRSRSPHRR